MGPWSKRIHASAGSQPPSPSAVGPHLNNECGGGAAHEQRMRLDMGGRTGPRDFTHKRNYIC
eukprot:3922249-Pyramimonas_sp.AAC.2